MDGKNVQSTRRMNDYRAHSSNIKVKSESDLSVGDTRSTQSLNLSWAASRHEAAFCTYHCFQTPTVNHPLVFEFMLDNPSPIDEEWSPLYRLDWTRGEWALPALRSLASVRVPPNHSHLERSNQRSLRSEAVHGIHRAHLSHIT
jgi:hypothetical protein